jgi:hypothetical protein
VGRRRFPARPLRRRAQGGGGRPSWSATDLIDPRTARVADRLVPRYDPEGLLARLMTAIAGTAL